MSSRPAAVAALALAVAAAGCSGAGPAGTASRRTASPSTSPSASRFATAPVRTLLPRLEAFVANERGLRFKHPVRVTLLGRAAFVAKLRATEGRSDAKDEEQAKSTLAALGLVPAGINLTKAFRGTLAAGTLGFYSPKTKRLYVRGTAATPGVQAVLSHELTHALTDQWFRLDRPAITRDDQEKDLAFTGLLEGDAERTRMAYEAAMPAAVKAEAEREESAGSSPPAGVPTVVLELIGLPYIVGPSFVQAVLLHGGMPALNAAYRHPPVSSEQLLQPSAFFAHDGPKPVAKPPADGPQVDASDLGQVGLLLMLEKRLDPAVAKAAVTGWGGDEYVTWRAGTQRWCTRDLSVMDSSIDAARVDAALRQWAGASGGRARIEQTGATTSFLSCSS